MRILVSILIFLCMPNICLAQGKMQLKRKWIVADKLPYITDQEFPRFVRDGVLVPLATNSTHVVDPSLDRDGHYIRPYVLAALVPFEQEFLRRFGHRIQINSGFRTTEHHEELRTRNGNAALGRSPHSTGGTIDIAWAWMTPREKSFTERWFLARHGKTLVFTKEHFQKCYDIFFRAPRLVPTPHHRIRKP
jgi:hypothetical protein